MQKTISFYELLSIPWLCVDPNKLKLIVDVVDFNFNVIDNIATTVAINTGMSYREVLEIFLEQEEETHRILNLVLKSNIFRNICRVNGKLCYSGNCDSLEEYLDYIQISSFHPEEMVAIVTADSLYGIPEIEISLA